VVKCLKKFGDNLCENLVKTCVNIDVEHRHLLQRRRFACDCCNFEASPFNFRHDGESKAATQEDAAGENEAMHFRIKTSS
jgi:epoxyqueuosine reductase QueG